MNGGGGEAAAEQIVPEALQLHIFPAEDPQISQHVRTNQQLGDPPGLGNTAEEEKHPKCQGNADVAEIQKIEYVSFSKPETHGHGLKYGQQQGGDQVFFHRVHLRFKRIISAEIEKGKREIGRICAAICLVFDRRNVLYSSGIHEGKRRKCGIRPWCCVQICHGIRSAFYGP